MANLNRHNIATDVPKRKTTTCDSHNTFTNNNLLKRQATAPLLLNC